MDKFYFIVQGVSRNRFNMVVFYCVNCRFCIYNLRNNLCNNNNNNNRILNNNIKFIIHRNPNGTDDTIHFTSYHPIAYNMAAYKSIVQRLLTILLVTEAYDTELSIIARLAVDKGYTSKCNVGDIVNKKKRNKTKSPQTHLPNEQKIC